MTHRQLQELVAAHALDALEADEVALVERHLTECPECRREFDDHRAVAALIGGQAVEVDVPDSLWDRVTRDTSAAAVVPMRRRRATLAGTVGAVAALVMLVVVQTARLSTTQDQLLAAEERLATIEAAVAVGDWSVLAAMADETPGAREVVLTGDADAEVVLLPDGTGYVLAAELDDLPSDRAYQLWVVQRGEVVSAGLLRRGVTGSVFRFDPATLDGIVVTEEVAAGVVVAEGPAVSVWFDA